MRALVPFLALMLAAAAPAPPSDRTEQPSAPGNAPRDEIEVRTAIWNEAKAMMERRDFAALNALAAGYRREDARTPSGTSKLAEVYDGIKDGLGYGDFDKGCEYTAGPFLKAWRDADPQSPSPYIVEAEMLANNGWCYRGSGFAAEVTEQGSMKFRAQLGRAEAVLREHRGVAEADPAYYETLLTLLNEQGRDESEFKATFDEAVARASGYIGIYFAAARHYLPQWGGTYVEVDQVARLAEQRAAATAAGGYARVYWYLIGCGCLNKEEMPLDRDLLRRSMAAMLAVYPDDWNTSNFAMIACKTDMPLDAQRYFLSLPANYDPRWHDATWWQFCREIAEVDKVSPALAKH